MATSSTKVEAGTSQAYLPLLLGTFVIAVCGLVYELIAGTISSYLLGDSVFQFSIVIGLFMTAMGLGAFLSRFIEAQLERAFVITQITLGLVGGLAAPALFFAFAFVDNYEAFLVLICVAIGTLVGLEIPLVTRILQQEKTLQINISNILTADYIGALVAALLFPLILVPQLGLISTSFLFGLLNLAVAGLACRVFRHVLDWKLPLITTVAAAILLTGALSSQRLVGVFEAALYREEIIYAETTPYQRIVVTHGNERVRLFLNGSLQFDSLDEHRYHESLVHPAMGLAGRTDAVLILGGGDGMAVREVLKHDGVQSVTLVDLDPAVTKLFRDHPRLTALNADALNDPRVEIVHEDAFRVSEVRQRTLQCDPDRSAGSEKPKPFQALQSSLLHRSRPPPHKRRHPHHPSDIPGLRPKSILEHRRDIGCHPQPLPTGSNPDDPTLPRLHPKLRRLGLHHGCAEVPRLGGHPLAR